MTLPFTPKFLKNFEFVLTSNRANRHYKSIHSSRAKFSFLAQPKLFYLLYLHTCCSNESILTINTIN